MEVSIKGKATFQPRLQDQNAAPSLEYRNTIDAIPLIRALHCG